MDDGDGVYLKGVFGSGAAKGGGGSRRGSLVQDCTFAHGADDAIDVNGKTIPPPPRCELERCTAEVVWFRFAFAKTNPLRARLLGHRRRSDRPPHGDRRVGARGRGGVGSKCQRRLGAGEGFARSSVRPRRGGRLRKPPGERSLFHFPHPLLSISVLLVLIFHSSCFLLNCSLSLSRSLPPLSLSVFRVLSIRCACIASWRRIAAPLSASATDTTGSKSRPSGSACVFFSPAADPKVTHFYS